MSKPTRADGLSDAHQRLAQHLGTVCRTRREALKLTRKAVAAQIGISNEYYGRIERGISLPNVETLAALATALKMSSDELLGMASGDAPIALPNAPELAPDMEALVSRLRQATPETRRIAGALLKEMRAIERRQRKKKSST